VWIFLSNFKNSNHYHNSNVKVFWINILTDEHTFWLLKKLIQLILAEWFVSVLSPLILNPIFTLSLADSKATTGPVSLGPFVDRSSSSLIFTAGGYHLPHTAFV